jgi:acetolactate synthase-1/2/3 large subunit
LFITGQDYKANITNSNGARQNGFQDLDIVSLVKPITKYSVLITDQNKIKYELERAYYYATNGRPGAVLVDIPIDIQFAEINPEHLEHFIADAPVSPPIYETEGIIRTLQESRRPVILVGGGVRLANAHGLLKQFVKDTNVPVVCTVNGLDVIEGNYGFGGIYGNTSANLAIKNSDLVIALGVRWGNHHVGKIPEKYTSARIIHVDIDSVELGRVFVNETRIHAHLESFLKQLLPALQKVTLSNYQAWHETIRGWALKYRENTLINHKGLDPVRTLELMLPLLSTESVLTNDVGQNQMWVCQAFKTKNGQRLLNSVGLGSMGYSLPAAIGAKIADPKRQVVAFMGDGGLQINAQELMLVGLRKLGVKCVVFNNKTLGMIREVQSRHYKAQFHGANPNEFACPDLQMLAQTYRLGYRIIEKLEDIETLASVFSDDLPYIIEVPLDLDTKLTNRYDEADCFEAERIND